EGDSRGLDEATAQETIDRAHARAAGGDHLAALHRRRRRAQGGEGKRQAEREQGGRQQDLDQGKAALRVAHRRDRNGAVAAPRAASPRDAGGAVATADIGEWPTGSPGIPTASRTDIGTSQT